MNDGTNGKNGTGNGRHKYRAQVKRTLKLAKVLFWQFRVFAICSTLAFLLSTSVLYFVYPIKDLPVHHHSFLGVAYDTLQMVFFQTPIPFVDDWRLAPVFFGLPILGLVIIAEGVVQLGHLLFQRRTYSREWQEMLAATFENHIIVAGLGNVGFPEVTVTMHQRNGAIDWNPPPATVLTNGDRLLLVADNKNLQTFLSCEQGMACLNV